jgi:membrane protease YdiL (CAAX protease family)
MGKIGPFALAAMAAMVALSFTNLFGMNIAGFAVYLGVAAFFVNKIIEKQPYEGSGLDIKAIGKNLSQKSIWFWIALPVVGEFTSATLSKLVLPEYITYTLDRTAGFISFTNLPLMLVEVVVLALGEEIAWRAFFQKQAIKKLPLAAVLAASSVLFAIGHVSPGPAIVVAYNIFFVCVNSVFYGIIAYKSDNAWVSTIAHVAANLFGLVYLPLLIA